MTRRQRQILDYIGEFESSNGYAPSYREIGEHFGLSSPATIHQHVQSLQEKGFLRSEHNSARSIELVKFKTNWAQAVDLMLAGLITAGEPIEAVEEHERIAVPADMAPHPDNSFVLKVKGDSMVDDGILDGDLVVCQRTDTADNGDIVVALIGNQYATLKRIYRENGRIRLQPANATMKPMYFKEVVVQGIVTGLLRKWA